MRFTLTFGVEMDTGKPSSVADALEELDEAMSAGSVSDEVITVGDTDGIWVDRMGFAPGKGV